jgi:hypothetical protein
MQNSRCSRHVRARRDWIDLIREVECARSVVTGITLKSRTLLGV